MLPGTIRQALVLRRNTLIGGLFSPQDGKARLWQVLHRHLWCGQAVNTAAVLFDAEDRGATGEHFGHGFDFDVAQNRRPPETLANIGWQ